ncbi:GNAT family N-acetyltransferase [Fodinicola feengrottensis]|uniref:GNAT family N-acetyltransferase n=1 Tax=Fodinicola feengrottensis TaxID=435914 RepID=A0ABP4TVP4_9ACTN
MDPRIALAAFDRQLRRTPEPDGPDVMIETGERVVRTISPGWTGVVWSDLDEATVDRVIAAELARFAELGRPWEWKHYSYDGPADLAERLLAAGFVPEAPETLLVAEIADLELEVPAPDGVRLVPVVGSEGANDLVAVHDEVFGGDHSKIGDTVLAGLAQQPATLAAVVAMAGDLAVSAGRVEFHQGTEFASIWGGGTLPAWRGRGVFRSLVAHRAALAAARGLRYLQVDATPDSRPILRRLGFVELATTTAYNHPGVV